MHVYLVIEHDYEGYRVLHVFADMASADRKMREYIEIKRAAVLANLKGYAAWAHDPNCAFSYEVLEFVVEGY